MKLFDEVKYLARIATAGSKEARELAKVKNNFERAYREFNVAETDGNVQHSYKKSVGNANYSLENGNKRKYNKRSRYNETETLFKIWENGSAPVGEVKKFTRNGKTRYYEKTENGCVELAWSQYNERTGVNVEKNYGRAEREISEAFNNDASTQRGIVGDHDSYRDNRGTVSVFGQALREELQHDSPRGVPSATGHDNRTDLNESEYNDEASDDSDASFITFSNDYAAIRNFMKEGDSGEEADAPVKYSFSEESNEQSAESKFLKYTRGYRRRDSLADFAPVREVTEENTATATTTKENATANKPHISLEDYANQKSPVWRNVAYDDDATKASIMQQTHDTMLAEGAVVKVTDSVTDTVEQAFPDLRSMKKKERNPILKNAMTRLKNDLQQFLEGFKNQGFAFEINGKVLDATLYNTGIDEVLEKITKQKANMLYSTEDVFRNARYLYSTPDYDGNPNVYRWNYFYTPIQIGNDTVGVRIAVRDMVKGTDGSTPESQIYNWGIKKDAPLDGGSHGPKVASSDVSSDASINNIPQNKSGVNRDVATKETVAEPKVDTTQALSYDSTINELKGGVISNGGREETSEAFLVRSSKTLLEVDERGALAFRYRRYSRQLSQNAQAAEEGLKKIGIPVVVFEQMESNKNE